MLNVCHEKMAIYIIADYITGLKLASLHSMAVDYVKTGQPAQLTRDLKPPKWPHFMEKVGKKQHQVYTSKKVLGQLYDQVERIDFVPAYTAPFDTRILQAYTLDENILRSAREIKEEYDAHMRRIMAQQEIKTEFEVWSTFVLQHSNTNNDFKYHEQIGEISMALKDQFRLICHERAGGKDYEHIGPFAAAMYEVTAREVTAALEECHRFQVVGGLSRPLREMTPSAMPLMSFPWLFQDVLGKIAKNNISEALSGMSIREELSSDVAVRPDKIKAAQPKRGRAGPSMFDSGDYLETSKGTTRPGEMLELFRRSSESCERNGHVEAEYIPSSSASAKSFNSSVGTSVERGSSADARLIGHSRPSSPEVLAGNPHGDRPDSVEVPKDNKSNSTTSSASHLRGLNDTWNSQRRIEVAGLAGKEQTAALNEAFLGHIFGDYKARKVEPNYITPEGSNLRLLNEDEPEDLELKSSKNEEENALKDVSLKARQLSKIDSSGELEQDDEKDILKTAEEEHHNANNGASYSSDSDAESDEVVLSLNSKERLFDQLLSIVGAESASHKSATLYPPNAIQDSTHQELNRSKPETVFLPASKSQLN